MQRLRSSAFWRSSTLRFFATYCLIALLIILLLGGALSLLFSRLMAQEMTTAGVNILSQLQSAQEFMLRRVERSNQEILLDPWISGAMEYYEPRVMSVLQRIKAKVEAVPITDDSIWSLCVYYMDSGVVLSSEASFQRLEEYHDADFLRMVSVDGSYRGNAYVRMSAKPGPDQASRVISFVSQYPFNRQTQPKILLVVNLKAAYLDTMINLIHTADTGALILYDAAGERISSAGMPLTREELDTLGAGIASYTPETAYGFKRGNGESLRVMRFESGMYGWQYLYVLPAEAILSKRGEVLSLTSLFCVLALIAGMLASWILSRQAVRPLRRLSTIVQDDGAKPPAYVDMASITDSVSTLVRESKSAKAVLTEYWISQRSLFLRELTLGNLSDPDEIRPLLEQYGLDLDPSAGFVVFCIAMNDYGPYLARYTPAEKNLHRIMEHEEIIAAVPQSMEAYCVDMRDNEKLLVCQTGGEEMADADDEGGLWRQAMATILADALGARLGFSYSVGVSRVRHTLDEIPGGYLEASFALADRAIWSGQKAILYDWFLSPQAARTAYPSRQERELLVALRAGDRTRALAALFEFHGQHGSDPCIGGAAMRSDYIRLFFATMQIVYEQNLSGQLEEGSSIDTFSALYHVDTPVQYTAVLAEHIDRLLLMQEEQNRNKQSLLIGRIIEHIETHLADDLSAAQLAAQFFISPTSLRRLFKENTGMTVKEYSLQARMNRAVSLLMQDMPVHRVAEEIGYASPQAFINAFKQVKGTSPAQFRRENRTPGS